MSNHTSGNSITPYPFLRRNYWAHNIEGGFFMGALPFISLDVVMPKLVQNLGGNDLMIALTPVSMMLGFMTPPLLIAHLVERVDHYKPICMWTGMIQRGAFGVAGLILYFFADDTPSLGLAAVLLAPYLSGIAGGVSMTAWMELVAKVIPTTKLSSSSAIRNVIGGMMGFIAGYVIKLTLENFPGYQGYGILFFITFVLTTISYILFAQIREPPTQRSDRPKPRTLASNIRNLPGFLKKEVQLRRFIVMGVLSTGMFIIMPFMGIHALNVTGQNDSFLGELVSLQMVGSMLGNLTGGYMGDRWGGKSTLVLARILLITAAIGMIFNTSEWGFRLLFCVQGFAFWLNQVGRLTMNIEICPPDRRPTFIAIMSMLTGIGMLTCSGISSWLMSSFNDFTIVASVSCALLLLAILELLRIHEPRKANT